jgi:dihydroorotase
MKTFYIDPHVHCRDWDQSYKATIKSVTELARSQGISTIFDMPNTKPPILTKVDVEKRLSTAKKEDCLDGYFTYIGITTDIHQIREAIEVATSHPRVVGIKMYADHVITDEMSQLKIFRELSNSGYDKVLAIHAEKKSLFREDLWDPKKPWTWNLVRSSEAEIQSVKDHIKFARESDFEGKLYFVHITTPETIDIIRKAKNDLDVYCAVTPHHATYSTLDMKTQEGLRFKVNSPLRDYETMMSLRDYTLKGKVDVIETDHAPHTEKEKFNPPYASGIRSLFFYSVFIESLRKEGATEELIHNLTHGNIKNIFEKIKK